MARGILCSDRKAAERKAAKRAAKKKKAADKKAADKRSADRKAVDQQTADKKIDLNRFGLYSVKEWRRSSEEIARRSTIFELPGPRGARTVQR